jgi:Ca2+-binding EF-hand superfamily protein
MLNPKIMFMALAAISLMATSANAETSTSYRYMYSDKDGNGFIEANEFDTYVYVAEDTNNDGILDKEQLSEYTSKTTMNTDTGVDYRTFDVWDIDRDRVLNESSKQASTNFNRFDTNGDGIITETEWQRSQR